MDGISKVFRHLARDVYVYFVPGFILICNLVHLQLLFKTALSPWGVSVTAWQGLVVVVAAFALGHLVFAVMYVAVEKTGLEKWLKLKLFCTNFEIKPKNEIPVFGKAPELHEQFIERHTELYLLRWNLAGAFMVCGITNFALGINKSTPSVVLGSALFLVAAVVTYLLSLRTEKDCCDRLKWILCNLNILEKDGASKREQADST